MKLKFLIDNALSPIFSKQLQAHGFDIIHVRDIHMEKCSDDEIFDFAQKASGGEKFFEGPLEGAGSPVLLASYALSYLA